MSERETLIASLCLLTDAAWEAGMPNLLTRAMLQRLVADRSLQGLVLRRTPDLGEALLERVCRLLSRAGRVGVCVSAYETKGYTALSRGDMHWPRQLAVLDGQAPHFLFLKGHEELLKGALISAAGSRAIYGDTCKLAEKMGGQLAQEGFTLVCGGAEGVDDAVQRGVLDAGGSVVLVPAVPVETLLLRKPYLRCALDAGKLLFVCDDLPDAPFSAKKALARNHTIYALGEAAIVLAARNGRGGSWHGASDALRGRFASVFVYDGQGPDFEGNAALMKLGAKPLDLRRTIGGQIRSCGTRQISLF